ncbi:acyl-CoA thioesterase [Natronorubrum sp. A-ect3]|uniref:acyl-CoA thioesterase n=1 Tax=Natronorubrum sp. A-ect3 TaxID=3242698 RepID=UPI00359E0CED
MGATDNTGEPEFQPVFENRVRFAETDQQGIVFYGEYFTFQDEAISQLFREIDYDYDRMHENGWQVHVANTELNYRNAAEFGDVIINEIRVVDIGTASFTSEYRAVRAADGERLADGTVTHVAVDRETETPTPIPETFREGVAAFQGGLSSE